MIRAVFTPRWVGALLLSALVAFGAYHLGWWQYHRYEAKHDRNARIMAHYFAAPTPLPDSLTTAGMPLASEWTKVVATGTYAGPSLVVRNRTYNGTNGFEVLDALDLGDGRSLLVDRGWVAPSGRGAADLPVVTARPGGRISVIGWLRVGEQSRHKAATNGVLPSINLAEASSAVGRPLLGAYLQLDGPAASSEVLPEAGNTAQQPRPLGKPNMDLGPHQAYAFQWWAVMPLGFVLTFFGVRREVREAAGVAPKPKKVRIWDEEDE